MNKPMRIKNPLMNMVSASLWDLPTPSTISMWWNLGSLLSVCLMVQIITGVFLTMHYSPTMESVFNSIIHIHREVNYGWLTRLTHANGASLFFLCILHIGRGMYYGSFKMKHTWISGNILLLLLMMTTFLGYMLPWGQMSMWGATVITNVVSAIPQLGQLIVNWLWGGFSVSKATLTRFFTLHYLAPFLVMGMTMIHLMTLHESGSSNPMGLSKNIDKSPFHPYFTNKDIMGGMMMMTMFVIVMLTNPYYMTSDPENFTPANPLVTPPHIQPEWYFLFAYTILRSIPNKLGGVLAMILSIMIIITMPFINKSHNQGIRFYPLNKMLFWLMLMVIIELTWIGSKPAEEPYITTGQWMTALHFSYFLISPMTLKMWDKLLN